MSVYKGDKLVAGKSVDTHFVRRPAWSQAIELSPVDLTAGYKAPADGMIVGSFYYSKTDRHYFFTLNGANIMPLLAGDTIRPLTLSLTVNKGDIIDCTVPSAADIVLLPSIKFVPFEYSVVSDAEVVTPELICNLHDPDWSHAKSITVNQLTAGYTAPGRGIIVGYFIANPGAVASIKINNILVARTTLSSDGSTGSTGCEGNVQCPVNKSDHITLVTSSSVESYKLAGEIYFVPYKAQ